MFWSDPGVNPNMGFPPMRIRLITRIEIFILKLLINYVKGCFFLKSALGFQVGTGSWNGSGSRLSQPGSATLDQRNSSDSSPVRNTNLSNNTFKIDEYIYNSFNFMKYSKNVTEM